MTHPTTALQLPPTVQGILAARIDRLAPDEKALLQQLAVIGREFPLSLLRHVITQPEEELYRVLASLQRKEFLYEQPAFLEVEYIFKHTLTQEVAYGTVLQERRKALHERTAQAMEALYRATLDEHYSELAHHYTRSGKAEKAVEYLHLAGQQAVQCSANTEAITHLTAALDLLLTRPETPERAAQELTLRLTLGPALMAAQAWAAPAVKQNYTRAQELCAQLDDSPQRFPVLFGLWAFYTVRGELRTAQALAQECLQLAAQANEDGLLVEAHYAAGTNFLWRGEFIRARTLMEQSATLYQPQHHALTPLYGGLNPKVFGLAFGAWALWSLGYPDQALTWSHEALHLAQEFSHPFSLTLAVSFAARLHIERGERDVTQERAEVTVAMSNEHGFPYFLAWGTVQQGAALIAQGKWEEGVAQIQQGLEAYEGDLSRTGYLAWLARGYGGAGQVEEGLAAVAEALRLVEKNDECIYEAEVYRIKGELLLAQEGLRPQAIGLREKTEEEGVRLQAVGFREKTEEAEGCFRRAIEIAQKQQAKSLELRATMSLARLWQSQGKHAEAQQRLATIYSWFTEGFDTKDLQEAKALLNELSH